MSSVLKTCSECKVAKTKDCFYYQKKSKDKLRYDCKECCKKRQVKSPYKLTEQQRALKNKKARENKSHLTKRFGLSKEAYEKLLISQEFSCAICKGHQSQFKHSLAVDHDHKTGKIRGLLCGSCNRGIGLLKDSSDMCLKAHMYLKG